jgi:hypothetical protein
VKEITSPRFETSPNFKAFLPFLIPTQLQEVLNASVAFRTIFNNGVRKIDHILELNIAVS